MANGQKITIDKKVAGFAAIAVVAAINSQGEVVAVHMTERSIKVDHFKTFLRKLFKIYKGAPFHVYLDNLGVHRNSTVRDLCDDNNCNLLFAPTYSSYLNAVERLWLFAKRPWRSRCLLECDYKSPA